MLSNSLKSLYNNLVILTNNCSILVPSLAETSENISKLYLFANSSASSLRTFLSFSKSHLFPTKTVLIFGVPFALTSFNHISTFSKLL